MGSGLILRRRVRAAQQPACHDKTHRAICDVAGAFLRMSDRPTMPGFAACHGDAAGRNARDDGRMFGSPGGYG